MRALKPISEKCKHASCPHPKCTDCKHCVRYHIFKKACGKVFMDLRTCRCKNFRGASDSR